MSLEFKLMFAVSCFVVSCGLFVADFSTSLNCIQYVAGNMGNTRAATQPASLSDTDSEDEDGFLSISESDTEEVEATLQRTRGGRK